MVTNSVCKMTNCTSEFPWDMRRLFMHTMGYFSAQFLFCSFRKYITLYCYCMLILTET